MYCDLTKLKEMVSVFSIIRNSSARSVFYGYRFAYGKISKKELKDFEEDIADEINNNYSWSEHHRGVKITLLKRNTKEYINAVEEEIKHLTYEANNILKCLKKLKESI